MAVTHLSFNDQTHHGGLLRGGLSALRNGLDGLNAIHNTIQTMIDGDGSSAAHFAYVTSKFSFPDDATSKAAFDELSSLLFKLNTNASVSDVNAAILQVFAKFG